jgi:flagellar biosynthesis protein FlhB
MLDMLERMLGGALLTLMPLFVALMVAAVAAPMVLGGLVFAPKVLGLKFDRLNPLQGLGRMFSLHGLAEMFKAILKSVLVGGVAALVLWYEFEHLFSLMVEPLETGMADFSDNDRLRHLADRAQPGPARRHRRALPVVGSPPQAAHDQGRAAPGSARVRG